MPAPIALSPNEAWMNPETRPSCKYSPVVVEKVQTAQAIEEMKAVVRTRIATAQRLAGTGRGRQIPWFSFLRVGPTHEPHLRPHSLPILVLSGGSAAKLAQELRGRQCLDLAWHPANVRGEPVYLIVHSLELRKYVDSLRGFLSCYRNLHIIGWDGGQLTGFGAARAAALAFADTLPYRPRRIIMMDQDVVQSTNVRYFAYGPGSAVERAHRRAGRVIPVLGLGVGYPTRVNQAGLRDARLSRLTGVPLPPPSEEDYDSPAQQAVSILAPFRAARLPYVDGVYPPYMVSGGEDMLMGLQLGLGRNKLVPGKIVKKGLEGPGDGHNEHWSGLRVAMLKAFYEAEKRTPVSWYGKSHTIETLLGVLIASRYQDPHPAEVYNTSSCIIERIILRLVKLEEFPDVDPSVFFIQRSLVA